LYFVGCAGAYDPGGQGISTSVMNLLERAGVNFALMAKESCNGEIIRRLGDEFTFTEVVKANISEFKKLKYKKVLASCPHCYSMLKNEYPEFGLDKEVVHHTDLFSDLLANGKLKPKNTIEKDLTYHDPCYLGRHNGIYEQPRKILESIPGIKITEMEQTKNKSFCCGMGGGNMWYEHGQGESTVSKRLEHIKETGKKEMAASCPFCSINFNLGSKTAGMDLEVSDVAQLLDKATE